MGRAKPRVSPEQLYDTLMASSRDALQIGLYNAAYHALASALHCVWETGDIGRSAEVARAAEEGLKWIDAHAPHYEHSTQSARARRHTSIWHGLIVQAQTHAKMLGAQRHPAIGASLRPQGLRPGD